MRCGRAGRVELDAFLLGDAEDGTIAEFREHYPHCADCAAAVADWMALDGALRAVMAEAGEPMTVHPEPEELARYVEAPARLGERAMQVENHLAGCASCANELRLITRFDPSIFGALEPTRVRADERRAVEKSPIESLREALSGFLERLRGFGLMAPMPALAMALVLLAGLWWSGALDGLSVGRSDGGAPQLVESTPKPGTPGHPPIPSEGPNGSPNGSAPVAVPGPGAEPESHEPLVAEQPAPAAVNGEGATELAAEPAPKSGPKPPEGVGDGAATRGPIEVAAGEAPSGATKASPDAGPATPGASAPSGTKGGPKAAAKTDEVLLAAVNELPPPSYATPAGADSMLWMRQFGAVRGNAPGTAHVRVRAPGDHTGLTLSPTPRLWWALDRKTDLPVQITIVEGDAIDPLVRVELPGPHAAGLHAFDLAKQGARLSPDVEYRWYVAIVVDPDRPSRNPVSAGSLRVAGPGDARRQDLGTADSADRGNRFAALGLWYDAFDFYASLAAAHPEVERLAAYRDRLVEVAHPTP